MHQGAGQRVAAGLLVAALASGCSSSATLTLRDGSEVSGRILRNDHDADTVWVEGHRPLERDKIVDVTHPGSAAMVTGGGLGAVSAGLVVAAVATHQTNEDCRGGDYCNMTSALLSLSAFVFAIPALILGVDGLPTYLGSRSRFAPPDGIEPTRRPMKTRPVPSKLERSPPVGAASPAQETEAPTPAREDAPQQPKRSPWCELRGCVDDPIKR